MIKVVNAIIINKDKFLTIKRKEGIHAEKWAFPGGIVEKGETEEQALKREIKEETNLNIVKIKKQISEYNYKREDNQTTLGKCFLVETKNFQVKINSEISEFKWVTFEEFENLDHIKGLEDEVLCAFNFESKPKQ